MRLIDADELKEAMEEHTDYKGYLVCDPEEIIDLAPTVQRPHGEWLRKNIDFGTCWATCSVCNKVSRGKAHDNGFGNDYSYHNFCPNCGSDNRPKEGEVNGKE